MQGRELIRSAGHDQEIGTSYTGGRIEFRIEDHDKEIGASSEKIYFFLRHGRTATGVRILR